MIGQSSTCTDRASLLLTILATATPLQFRTEAKVSKPSEGMNGYSSSVSSLSNRLFRTYYAKPAQKPYWARIFLKSQIFRLEALPSKAYRVSVLIATAKTVRTFLIPETPDLTPFLP
jgi:hypothetical protein